MGRGTVGRERGHRDGHARSRPERSWRWTAARPTRRRRRRLERRSSIGHARRAAARDDREARPDRGRGWGGLPGRPQEGPTASRRDGVETRRVADGGAGADPARERVPLRPWLPEFSRVAHAGHGGGRRRARTQAARDTCGAPRHGRDRHAAPPLVDSPKCPRCSLVGICLPDETNTIRLARARRTPTRRLLPTRPDVAPLYVQEPGSVVRLTGGRIEVRKDRELVTSMRLVDVLEVALMGGASISGPALRELVSAGVPVTHFTHGGARRSPSGSRRTTSIFGSRSSARPTTGMQRSS